MGMTESSTKAYKPPRVTDPEKVPVVSKDVHLPTISEHLLHEEGLRQRFRQDLPWSSELTDESRQATARLAAVSAQRGSQATPAAVLIPLSQHKTGLHVLLTQRTAHLHDHPGQISFPGGRVDPEDESLIATALREAHEEIGLLPEHVEVLGTLPLYHTVTGYEVTPVVGLVPAQGQFSYRLDAFEVAEIFEVPLQFLMNPSHHELRQWQSEDGVRQFYSMPYQNKFIWGATAGMLRNLYHFLRA